jgi:acetamidase/formamidase
MALHEIDYGTETLHGYFSRDIPPVLRIDPGDTVRFRTLDARFGMYSPHEHEHFSHLRKEGMVHALCGPVAIHGAKPGMTLAVHIDELRLGDWGWTRAMLPGDPFEDMTLRWTLDAERLIGRDQHGHEIRLQPFMGVMGMPADEGGLQSTGPPRLTGGNLDCKELIAGSTLYLPIALEGGLFSVGDAHAVQSDGEASGTAIECPMERCELTFQLEDEMPLGAPRAHTATAWLSFGLDEDLDKAAAMALDGMLDLMVEQFAIERRVALGLASLIVDLRITQMVNGVKGVHAVLAHQSLNSL